MPDTYVTLVTWYVETSPGLGYEFVASWDGRRFGEEGLAVMNGWRTKSDDKNYVDFAVGVVRDGRLVDTRRGGRSWGETAEYLRELAVAVGLEPEGTDRA